MTYITKLYSYINLRLGSVYKYDFSKLLTSNMTQSYKIKD